MKDRELAAKLAQALRLLAECGCTVERERGPHVCLRVSVPNCFDPILTQTNSDSTVVEPDSKIERNASILTPQRVEVLLRISVAKPNKQIAYELGITETTVKAHVTNIYRRLGVRNVSVRLRPPCLLGWDGIEAMSW